MAGSEPRRHLSLIDSTSIIVGIMIGAGIYETTPLVASSVGGAWQLMGVWVLGGLASLVGAMCYAELTTSYPQDGGDYVFVREAYGRGMGFLLGWCWFWVVRPGNVGAMALIFGRYASHMPGGGSEGAWAVGAVLALGVANTLGLRTGARVQNVLTGVKVAGLVVILVLGLVGTSGTAAVEGRALGERNFSLAMILVLFTYGGWNDISYVAAEVREPRKNLLKSMALGVAGVTLIYVVVNAALIRAVGFEGAQRLDAAHIMQAVWGNSLLISTLVCVSTLGAINGMLLTGGRVYYAMGADHRMLRWLGHWDPKFGTPARSLVLQTIVTVGLIVGFGFYENGFERMVVFTTPVFWFFLTLVGVAIFILRRKPVTTAVYRVPLYPLTPMLFVAMCGFMLYAGARYALEQGYVEGLWTGGVIATGLLLCAWDKIKH